MNKKKLNIFIADDESIIRIDIKEILEENNYNVIGEAKTGKEVLDFCSKQTPDLILLDIKMPEMTGLEVLKELNKNTDYYKVPVIMITAYNDKNFVKEAIELGVFSYITKPIKTNDLLNAIEITKAKSDELKSIYEQVNKLKEAIEVRKIVEIAKGILMKKNNWSEKEAFRHIQKTSMDLRTPMKDIAKKIIDENSEN
jgi:response regulator NasT